MREGERKRESERKKERKREKLNIHIYIKSGASDGLFILFYLFFFFYWLGFFVNNCI